MFFFLICFVVGIFWRN